MRFEFEHLRSTEQFDRDYVESLQNPTFDGSVDSLEAISDWRKHDRNDETNHN